MQADRTPDDISHAFAELGQIVLGSDPLPAVLERVVHIASGVLPITTEASITLIAGDDPCTVAFTGAVAIALDERQYEADSGPCLHAASAGQLILITDMAAETRWRRYASGAVDHGIQSSLSVPLPLQRNVTGALNFYATDADAFSGETIDLATTFAGHAAVAVANAHVYEATAALAEQMRQAMSTRAVIEQAKGIVMAQRSCNSDEAFDALVRLSQTSHRKLREVAQQLVDKVADGGPDQESTR